MESLGQFLQTADWKNEKHVPVIHAPETVKKGEEFDVKVMVGEEIKHPNQLEHHIKWIKVFFHGENDKFPIELATFLFTAHGEAGVFNEPVGKTVAKLDHSGKLYAMAYCNIHGLWENNVAIKVTE